MSQRLFLKAAAFLAVLLAACTPQSPQIIEVTRIVEVTPTSIGQATQDGKARSTTAPDQPPAQQARQPSPRAASAAPAPAAKQGGPIGSDAPRLFFTDLESGPNDGGQDNLGAFVTIYGEGFGVNRGASTVTIGGKEVAKYVAWGQDNAPARKMDMIVVQPGPNAASGEIVVTVNGKASNPLPFTVRAGKIYFITQNAPNANDANPGTFEAPFKTIYRPRDVLQAGTSFTSRVGHSAPLIPSIQAGMLSCFSRLTPTPKAQRTDRSPTLVIRVTAQCSGVRRCGGGFSSRKRWSIS